jgi:hypothetical protein
MLIQFEELVIWDASNMMFGADCDGERIVCRAGREAINELPGYTNATSGDIAREKKAIADLLKPSFELKIRNAALDQPNC